MLPDRIAHQFDHEDRFPNARPAEKADLPSARIRRQQVERFYVLRAVSMSRTSGSRHSPRTIRSGRIRRAVRTSSVMVTAPTPWMLLPRRLDHLHALLDAVVAHVIADGSAPAWEWAWTLIARVARTTQIGRAHV